MKALFKKVILIIEKKQSLKLNILEVIHLFVSTWETVTIENTKLHEADVWIVDVATEDDYDPILPKEWNQIEGADGYACLCKCQAPEIR